MLKINMKIIVKYIILLFILTNNVTAQSIKQKLEDAFNILPHPTSVKDFTAIPHLTSLNQDSTLVCWSFTVSSFIESEMIRLGKEPVRLSVMFSVYYGFIEKAKRFIQTRGKSQFSPGDLFSGTLDVVKQYGAMPAEAYEGIKSSGIIYNHNALYAQLDSLMGKVKVDNKWNEEKIIDGIKTVLDKYLGRPPNSFIYKGKEYSPKTFQQEIVNLPWNEYIAITSFQYAPFYQFVELRVPDNWKRDTNFFNVPLNQFYSSLLNAVKNEYSVAIDMDNSETSYRMTKRYAFVPQFEVPKDSITQEKRESLFLSDATTDDHLMHIVSYRKFGNEDWFLAKDSWRTAWEGKNHGYFFMHESYIKLKVLAFLVHREGVPDVEQLIQIK